jgi:hypothetical protein
MISTTAIMLTLYILTIFGTVGALWEAFPGEFATARRISMAVALTSLFFTFLLTSESMDSIETHVAGIRKDVDNLQFAGKWGSTLNPHNVADGILDDMLTQTQHRLYEVLKNKDGELSESEAIGLFVELLENELKTNPDELKIYAVSVNPDEFNTSPGMKTNPYEGAIARVALKGFVQRTYYISDDLLRAFQSDKHLAPETIANRLMELRLDAISRHYAVHRLTCILTGPNRMFLKNPSEYDNIVVLRGATILFAVNRSKTGMLRVILADNKASRDLLTMCTDIAQWGIWLPMYPKTEVKELKQ